QPASPAQYPERSDSDAVMVGTERRRRWGGRAGPVGGGAVVGRGSPPGHRGAGRLLDGHDVRDAVSAAWSLLGNRLGAQAGAADPNPADLARLHRQLADRPPPWATRRRPPTLPPS